MIGLWIYCLTPFVTAGLVYAEHRLLRRVKRDQDLTRSTRRALFLAIYLGPLLFYLLITLTIAGIYLDGMTAWLGESHHIARQEEFMVNLFFVVAVSWPFLGMYSLLGGLVALVNWREKDELAQASLDTGSY
jgi:small-conductance mechanosensitive channel